MALFVQNKDSVTKSLITNKVIHRKSLFSKATGLMFHSKIFDEAHVFYFSKQFRISLTMFFVFFPIDVVFLRDMKVVEIKKNLRPFTNYTSKREADMFIELPKGFISKHKIGVGSRLFLS